MIKCLRNVKALSHLRSSCPLDLHKHLDTTFLIILPALVQSVSKNMAQKSSRNLTITGDTGCFNNFINTVIPDEDNLIRESLSSLKPHERHQNVRAERLDGVGDWFLETSEFRKWNEGEDGSLEQVLFCSGGPGMGKTFMW